jgi:hypothetical protein
VVPLFSAGHSGRETAAFSPDGETIAVARSGIPYLYHLNKGLQEFDWNSYDLPGLGSQPLFLDPSFSPSGKQLAWAVKFGDMFGGENVPSGVAIFDLENHSLVFARTPTLSYFEGSGQYFSWSPDEKYIFLQDYFLNTQLLLSTENGEIISIADSISWSPDNTIIITKNKTNQPYYLFQYKLTLSSDGNRIEIYDASPVAFSPDSRKLILFGRFYDYNLRVTQQAYRLFNLKSRDLYPLDLPEDSEIIDWIKVSLPK